MQIYPNHITVKINDVEYTDKCPFPTTFNQLLAKQLDEFTLELLQIDKPIFKPITTVIITVWNEKYPIEDYPEKALRLRYVITSCKSNEIPAGSGKYNHQLALIEETKYLECFIVRSCGFVNPLRKEYTKIKVVPNVYQTGGPSGGDVFLNENDITYRPESPLKLGEQTFASWRTVVNKTSSVLGGLYWSGTVEFLDANNEILASQTNEDSVLIVSVNNIGNYTLRYKVNYAIVGEVPQNYYWNIDYAIYVA